MTKFGAFLQKQRIISQMKGSGNISIIKCIFKAQIMFMVHIFYNKDETLKENIRKIDTFDQTNIGLSLCINVCSRIETLQINISNTPMIHPSNTNKRNIIFLKTLWKQNTLYSGEVHHHPLSKIAISPEPNICWISDQSVNSSFQNTFSKQQN